MANETKITDIVDKKAIKDLTDLNLKINEIAEAYRNAVKEIGAGLVIKVNGLDDYSKKLEKLTAAMEKSAVADSALREAKKEQEVLLKKIAEQMSVNTKEALEKAKADRVAEQAALAAAKAETERLKQEKLLNQTRRQAKVSIEEAIALTKIEVKTDREAMEQNRLLRAAKKDVDATTKEGKQIIEQMNAAIDKNTAFIRKNADGLVNQKMKVGDYKNEIKAALNEMSRGENVMRNFGKALKSGVGAGVSEVSIGVGSMIKGMIGAQAIIGGFQSLIGLFRGGIRSVIDFETANSQLAAILGTTSEKIKDLTNDAQRLGATTKYTAAQATELQTELAKLGFTKIEILDSTGAILRFAQATGAGLADAAALSGAALRMFNADTRETERYVSAMAVATSRSALSFSYLATALPIVGPVAKAFNFEIEDTLALLGKLSDAGFDASMSATATRNILLNLADGSGKLAKALGQPVKSLPELVAGLKKLKEQGIDLNTTLDLTDKRSVAAFNAFLTSADKLVPLRNQITGAEGELADMAHTMGDNVKGAVNNLSSAWEAFMLSFSNGTGPAKEFLNWMADKIRNIADSMKDPEQRTTSIGLEAQLLGEKTRETSLLETKTEYNKEYKRLLKEGDSEEQASFKATAAISSKKIEIREDELKKLEQLKQKAIDIGKESEKESRLSWKKFFLGNGIDNGDAKRLENEAIAARKEYMLYQYAISKKEAKNAAVDDFSSSKKTKDTKKLTDEEKKEIEKKKAAAEKAANERLKILETYQQSELDLMDDGLDKELAKISFNYTKKMAAVKGQSEEEIATRQNIAEEMKRAIEDKTTSYGIAKEQKDIANKLEAVKKGSKEEFDLRVEQLELQRDIETTEAIKTGEGIFAIDDKYNAKRTELVEKFANEQNKKMQEGYSVRSIISNQEMEKELSDLAREYTKGRINKEKYEEEKLKIQQRYAIKQAELAIEVAKLQLGTGGLSEEDEMAIKNKIANAEMALARLVTDTKISEMEREDDVRKEKLKNWEDGLAMVGDALNAFSDLGSAIYDRKIEEVEGEQEANDEAGQKEIDRITHLEEAGVISKEEAEARKRAAEQTTATKEAELAKKKADLQTKQAKMEKANAIAQCIIQTALAAIKVWGQTGIGGIALAPLVIALGAIQLATIVAQPIPKYAKGTDNHPGGLAIVGDGGKHEAVAVGSKYFITPDTSTLVDLPHGAKVIPDIDKEMADLHNMAVISDAMMLYSSKREDGSRVTINNDYSDLKNEMKTTNRILSNMDKKRKRISNYQSFNNYVNSRL